MQDGLNTIGCPELTTLLLAVIRGLLLDLDATADTTRAEQAFRQFLDILDARSRDERPAAHKATGG
ncbi:hypothetical protein [Actinoplanes sp. M2I2]|uniref:hypothetical protein n=1 Tax=Actinoplanes sp. M2I2 TaxID=1734444 RepID=UPI00201FE4E0|nr:hypothetical protein [Actinoplanes sp. M2I2]